MVKLLADSNSRLSSDSAVNDLAPRRRLRDLTGLRLLRIIERQNRRKGIINSTLYLSQIAHDHNSPHMTYCSRAS